MVNISNTNPVQFKKMYPDGVYGYILEWDSDKIKPSYLTYPSKIIVNAECTAYFSVNKKGIVTRIGYFPHRVSLVDSDLQKVKDSFISAIKRCADGRVKWLEEQRIKINQTADGMIEKTLKL